MNFNSQVSNATCSKLLLIVLLALSSVGQADMDFHAFNVAVDLDFVAAELSLNWGFSWNAGLSRNSFVMSEKSFKVSPVTQVLSLKDGILLLLYLDQNTQPQGIRGLCPLWHQNSIIIILLFPVCHSHPPIWIGYRDYAMLSQLLLFYSFFIITL